MLLNTYEPWKFAFSQDTENIKENSFGIIGVPFDSTTSYHSGARLGPIVVREASFGFEKYNTIFNKELTTTFYDDGTIGIEFVGEETILKVVDKNDYTYEFWLRSEDNVAMAYEFLTKEQEAAVKHVYGPMMVVAGPGSGKTMVLTQRIKRLLDYTKPERSLLLPT